MSSESYVIGIDGGGTKSRLYVADLSGAKLGEAIGGPTNLHAIGEAAVTESLRSLIGSATEEAGRRIENCAALCLASAGADRPDDRAALEQIVAACGIRGVITVTNDAEPVLAAGSGGREGVAVISGTGSLAYGRRASGLMARAGGWGHLIGDEGSGYAIGAKGIAAAVRAYDGREAPTLLMPRLMEHLGLSRMERIVPYVYQSAGKKEIAALAAVVHQAYLEGDEASARILKEAAEELALMAGAVIEALSFGEEPLTVVCSGSVFANMNYIYATFTELLQRSYPLAKAVLKGTDAAYGAALLALLSLQDNP